MDFSPMSTRTWSQEQDQPELEKEASLLSHNYFLLSSLLIHFSIDRSLACSGYLKNAHYVIT